MDCGKKSREKNHNIADVYSLELAGQKIEAQKREGDNKIVIGFRQISKEQVGQYRHKYDKGSAYKPGVGGGGISYALGDKNENQPKKKPEY